jgi:hypothetical protein
MKKMGAQLPPLVSFYLPVNSANMAIEVIPGNEQQQHGKNNDQYYGNTV